MFDLGLGEALVAVTDYCIHPVGQVSTLIKIGGTKNPDITEIIRLEPDLILANQEENTPQAIHHLQQAGLRVHMTFPQTVDQSLDDLISLAVLFKSEQAISFIQELKLEWDNTRTSVNALAPIPFFCPIWFEKMRNGHPWFMTFNQHTYCHDLLTQLGGRNCFSNRSRRYPLEADLGLLQPEPDDGRDTRYPRITFAEIVSAEPEIIILPDEPFPFNQDHHALFLQMWNDRVDEKHPGIFPIDGSLITWHGTRLRRALPIIREIFLKNKR
jgi:iron complex transport system substrate-binding protein